jgi:hypothetical protein
MSETVQPMTCNRLSGGWLAVSPPGAEFRIGVTGASEQEARDRFHVAWDRWTKTLHDADDAQHTH